MADAARSAEGSHRPDPWGVKRAENLLQTLQGITSARIVVSPVGEIIEVHVLSDGEQSPKQVVRNVESALLAQLGLKVDHRKISVAQTGAGVEPLRRAMDQPGHALQKRGVLYEKLEVVSAGPNRIRFVAHMVVKGEEVTGESLAADSPNARLQAAARAGVLALEKVIPQGTLQLDGIRILDAFGRSLVVVGLHAVEGRNSELLVGTAGARDSTEPAAVLAVLDATNRWLETRFAA